MRILLAVTIAAFALAAAPAAAQIADKRSFMHPLGFWSNKCFVAQRRVYPPVSRTGHPVPVRYADPELAANTRGGGLLHERNW